MDVWHPKAQTNTNNLHAWKIFWGAIFTHWSISAGVNFPIWLPYFLGVQVQRSQETIKNYCISLKNQIAWWSSEVEFWVLSQCCSSSRALVLKGKRWNLVPALMILPQWCWWCTAIWSCQRNSNFLWPLREAVLPACKVSDRVKSGVPDSPRC